VNAHDFDCCSGVSRPNITAETGCSSCFDRREYELRLALAGLHGRFAEREKMRVEGRGYTDVADDMRDLLGALDGLVKSDD
jgi:hypothetical protein